MHEILFRDAILGFIWLAVNCYLAIGSWQMARRIDSGAPFVEKAMHSLVIGTSIVVISAIACGILGVLSSGLTLVGVVAVIAVAMNRFLSRDLAVPSDSKRGDILKSRSRLEPDCSIPANGSWWVQIGWNFVWTVFGAYLLAHITVNGLLKFPTDFDCLMYHIPMIDEWLQRGSLFAPDSAYWWSPGNSELVGLWCVAPFSGDFLIALNNLPIIALWVVATQSSARSLGLSRTCSHLSTIAVIAVHTSFHETDDASNDLALVAFFTAAVAYALRHIRNGNRSDLILGGLSMGLLLGVKYFSVGYLALVAGVWLIIVSCRQSAARSIWSAVLLGIATLPAGAYWYLRNLAISGSPVYPMRLSGSTPAVGYPHVFETSFWGNPDPSRWSFVLPGLWKMTGPCHVISLLAAPLVFLCLMGFAIFHRGRKDDAWSAVGFGAILFGCGALLLITPFAVEDQPETLNHLRWAYTPVRYGLCFLSFAVIGMVWLLQNALNAVGHWIVSQSPHRIVSQFDRILQLATGTTVAGLVLWQLVHRLDYGIEEFDVVKTARLGINLPLLVLGWRMIPNFSSAPRVSRFTACVAGSALFATMVLPLSRQWHQEYDLHYNRFLRTRLFSSLIEAEVSDKRICVLDLQVYPFFGSARQRYVCRPRYIESAEWLMNYLRRRNVSLVVTHYGRNLEFDMYREAPALLKSQPDAFEPQMFGEPYEVYRFETDGDTVMGPRTFDDVARGRYGVR
jgi:hypothetical protein